MSIPVIAGPLGYDSWYVKVFRNICEIVGNPKKFVLEWIAPEKKLIVHTDRLDDATSYRITSMLDYTVPAGIEVVRYNHHIEVNWRDINKYAECQRGYQVLAVNPDYKNDLTSDGWWVYPWPKFQSNDLISCFANQPKLKVMYFTAGGLNCHGFVQDCKNLQFLSFDCTGIWYATSFAENCTELREVIFQRNFSVMGAKYWFYGCKKLSKLTFAGTWKISGGEVQHMWYGCILDKESVLGLFEKNASGKGFYTTIGIHVDHKYDPEVNLALKKADIKYTPTVELPEEVTEGQGWTLTVQWNGTPTAQAATTYGLRAPLIYARVGEMERPDGTTERFLDWGHYVTNPEEYETFRSLESAYEYFGLPNPDTQQ